MNLLLWIILFTLLGGVLSVMVASVFLLFREDLRLRLVPHLVSFATGALLGAAFLALLPHALAGPGVDDYHHIMMAVLGGVLLFFLLEKAVLWRHCHSMSCEAHAPGHDHNHTHKAAGTLILVGDGLHNFVDGVLIGAAFLTDIHLGVVTAIAVAAHEIPQEVGDFAILLHSGYSRAKALLYNVLTGATTVLGGLLAYAGLSDTQHLLPYVLAVAAASFIYIAVADLIPGLHRSMHARAAVQQIVLIAAGVLMIYISHSTLH